MLTTSSRTRSLALAGIAVPIWFTTLVGLQGVLNPDYSHVKLPISALAAWPSGWIQNLNFYISGVLMMLFITGLNAAVRSTSRGRAGVPLLLIGGAALVTTGMFPWKMIDGILIEPPAHAATAITTLNRLPPRMATSRMEKRIMGKARVVSATRISNASMRPPAYPAISPIAAPTPPRACATPRDR